MFGIATRGLVKGAAAAAVLSLGLSVAATPTLAETELRVVPHAGLKILDPIWTTAYISRNHGYMIYDTLFGLDADGNIQNQMVDSVTRSDDGLTVTLTLRDGLMWHDMQPVTAADAVASIERWGSKDAMGQKLMSFTESLTADGDKNIVFKLSVPTGLVELALSKPSSNVPFMMPARIAATPGSEQIEEYIGSGPYKMNLDEWEPGVKVVYDKFDEYVPRSEEPSAFAGGKIAKVDRVVWTPNRDIQQAINALNAGEVDIIESVPADLIPLVKDGGAAYVKDPNPPGLQYTARFNVLARQYSTDLYRYGVWLCGSDALAKDLVQETFLRAWRAIDSLKDDRAAKSWLITILRREYARTFERKVPKFSSAR